MKKVLVVEDNINSRNMITNVLSQIDPSLKIYETGSEYSRPYGKGGFTAVMFI